MSLEEKSEVVDTENASYAYDWFDISLNGPEVVKPVDCTSCFALNQPELDGSARKHNFFKIAKWSPDGSVIVSSSQDKRLRIFFTPPAATSKIYEKEELPDKAGGLSPHLSIARSMPSTAIDWYPFMDAYQDASNCCFLVGSTDHPLHLIDCLTGETRGSYPIIDHREKFIGPTSITFHPGGRWVYCGYENMIQIIDITRPGWEGCKQKTSPSRKEQTGQKGMISCLEFQPGHVAGVYAAGSFFGSVGLYDERQGSIPAQLFPKSSLLRGRGITHLQFCTQNPNLLYIGARRSSVILEYDIRQPNYPTQVFPRELNSDQRLSFDVKHNHLVTGDQDGLISIFDLSHPQHEAKGSINWAIPTYQFQAQEGPGAIGSAQFHPAMPILMTASGSRIRDPLETSPSPDQSFLKLWSLPYHQKLHYEV